MVMLTVFTPTYNRRENLESLYVSLLAQNNHTFRWLIVDDGSSDDTETVVRIWKKEQKLDITYYRQPNGGKNRAIHKAIELCDTPWMICVDSDDLLTENAVEIMLDDVQRTQPEGVLGYIYPQKLSNAKGEKWLPESVSYLNIMDAKHLYGISETAVLFRTEYLKQLELTAFEGEKFLSEEVLYIKLADYGMFIPRNDAFYISEYRDDGMTKNLFRLWLANPQGTICLLQERFRYCGRYPFALRVKNRIKCIMNLNAFCMAVRRSVFELTPNKLYSAVLYVPSMFWKRIRFDNGEKNG